VTPKTTPALSRAESHSSLFALGKDPGGGGAGGGVVGGLFSKDTGGGVVGGLFSKDNGLFSKDTGLFGMFKRPEAIGGETYKWDGKEVIVTEQVRVSSADPNFIAVLAKLAVLEERVVHLRGKVEIVELGVQKTY